MNGVASGNCCSGRIVRHSENGHRSDNCLAVAFREMSRDSARLGIVFAVCPCDERIECLPAWQRRLQFSSCARGARNDRLAHSVAELHAEFELALASNRRKYSVSEFRLFADAVRNYVGAVNGLVHVRGERKRVPGEVAVRGQQTGESDFAVNPGMWFSPVNRESTSR